MSEKNERLLKSENDFKPKKIVEIRNLVKDYGVKGFQSRVLKGIDLTVFSDDFIAIMGPSGSGKTTLLNILSSVDKPTLGDVLLDGKDITRLSNKELSKLRRDKIGFIFQDYNLLDTMSLKDNIALPLTLNGVSGKECSRKVEELAEMFGLKDHLAKYPYQLSGGQKQRLCIARALLKHPKVLILDDSTSAVDTATDAKIREALQTVIPGTTKIIIAQRISSVQDADRILVLEDGRISGFDTHENLLRTNVIYQEIYEAQTKGGGDFDHEQASE